MVLKERVKEKQTAGRTVVPEKIWGEEEKRKGTKKFLWIGVIVLAVILIGGFFYWLGTKEKPSQGTTATQPAAPAQQIGQQQPPQPQPAATPASDRNTAPIPASKKGVGASSDPVPAGTPIILDMGYRGREMEATVIGTIKNPKQDWVTVVLKIKALKDSNMALFLDAKLLNLKGELLDANMASAAKSLSAGTSTVAAVSFRMTEVSGEEILYWKTNSGFAKFKIGPLPFYNEWPPDLQENLDKIKID